MTNLRNQETDRENTKSYNNGYLDGVREQQIHEENRRVRDTNNVANGIMIGLLLTVLAALGIGSYVFATRKQEAPVVPLPEAPTIVIPEQPSSNTERESTTIRERVQEIVPVPTPTPAPAQPEAKESQPESAPLNTEPNESPDSSNSQN